MDIITGLSTQTGVYGIISIEIFIIDKSFKLICTANKPVPPSFQLSFQLFLFCFLFFKKYFVVYPTQD